MSELWLDQGEASQGKIITAMLQGDQSKARFLLRRWSSDDLTALDRAAEALSLIIRQEKVRRS